MAETRSASQANQAQLLDNIMLAINELKTKHDDSTTKIQEQLQRQQQRLDALEQHTASDEDAEAGAANLCTNPTCAQLHGTRRVRFVEAGHVHEFCGLTCASAVQGPKGPAGLQPFPAEGAPAAPFPTSSDSQYPLGEDMRDALARKPEQFTQNASLVRLRMQLQDINQAIQERVSKATRQDAEFKEIYDSLIELEGKFNIHIDAFVVTPCVMQVADKVAAGAFNQGVGANLFSTTQGTELFQSWAKKSLENAQKKATETRRSRGGSGAQANGRRRGARGGQNPRQGNQQPQQQQQPQAQQQQRGRSRSSRASRPPPRGADGGPAQP